MGDLHPTHRPGNCPTCGAAPIFFGKQPEAADELSALRERVAALEAENDRLTKAVGSGILGELLNDEETDEFVKFIKFLRGQTKEAGCGKV